MNDDKYKTLKSPCSAEYVTQRSRFFGNAARVNTAEEAQAFIKEISGKNPDSNHCCWAYKTGFPDNTQQHYNDAGEPSGTAGRPIAEAISQAELENVVIVVCRFFGGVKLGIRGLINAYHQSAKLTLENAETIICQPMISKSFELPYAAFEKLKHKAESLGGKIKSCEFADLVKCTAIIPHNEAEKLNLFKQNHHR